MRNATPNRVAGGLKPLAPTPPGGSITYRTRFISNITLRFHPTFPDTNETLCLEPGIEHPLLRRCRSRQMPIAFATHTCDDRRAQTNS